MKISSYFTHWRGANETSGRRRGSVECLARATDEEIQSLTDEETFAQLGLTIGQVVRLPGFVFKCRNFDNMNPLLIEEFLLIADFCWFATAWIGEQTIDDFC